MCSVCWLIKQQHTLKLISLIIASSKKKILYLLPEKPPTVFKITKQMIFLHLCNIVCHLFYSFLNYDVECVRKVTWCIHKYFTKNVFLKFRIFIQFLFELSYISCFLTHKFHNQYHLRFIFYILDVSLIRSNMYIKSLTDLMIQNKFNLKTSVQ